MTTISREGSYELRQGRARVGYFVAIGPLQHWVLYERYVPPSPTSRRVELEFRRTAEALPRDPRALFAQVGVPGAKYIYGEPVDLMVEQIDSGCHQVSQDERLVGVVCVSGSRPTTIERWALARASTRRFFPFQPIGTSDVTTLRFDWLGGRQGGVEPSPPGLALSRKLFGFDGSLTSAPTHLHEDGGLTLHVNVVCHERTADVGS